MVQSGNANEPYADVQPAEVPALLHHPAELRDLAQRHRSAARLEFGRIVASELEVLNMLANLV